MKVKSFLAVLAFGMPLCAQTASDSLANVYQNRIDSLAAACNHQSPDATLNPYMFPILSQGTLYSRPLQQTMGIQNQAPDTDPQLKSVNYMNSTLASIYASNPELFQQTEEQVREAGTLRENVEAPVEVVEVSMAEQAVNAELDANDVEAVEAETKRPKFWTTKGDASLQFTQSYFSENWYQGGENNYSGLGMVTLQANFDNKKKIQWENKLEAQLGFQTKKSDEYKRFNPTSNLLRLTSKFGYKANDHWFYSAQLLTYTQIVRNYEKKGDDYKVKSDFTSPLNGALSLGMDYKLKKEKFSCSVYLAPLTYNLRFCARHDLRIPYGIMEKDETRHIHAKHDPGLSATINAEWKVCKNVVWASRFYWFTSFHYTVLELENTITFTINKYLNARFFFYPRLDDSSPAYKNEHDRYYMMKEWLSLGISYSF